MPDSAGTADSPGMVVQWHMAAGSRTAAVAETAAR